jgi:hypothetical protein
MKLAATSLDEPQPLLVSHGDIVVPRLARDGGDTNQLMSHLQSATVGVSHKEDPIASVSSEVTPTNRRVKQRVSRDHLGWRRFFRCLHLLCLYLFYLLRLFG